MAACYNTSVIRVLERKNMYLFQNPYSIKLQAEESFYQLSARYLLPFSDYQPPFVHLISRMVHNYIVFVTYNRKTRLYVLRVAEMIIPQE